MKKKRLFPTIMASLMSISMMTVFPMGASATGSNYSNILASGENTTTLTKNLVIENDANIPACSFTFTASVPESDIPATSNTLAVLKGVGADKIKFGDKDTADGNGTIVYSAQDINLTSPNPTDNVVVTNIEGDTYLATKTIQLDFSQCGFTEPGVYRYIITETGTNQGITNDNPNTRTIDVYVEDATDDTGKKLKIAGYVMYVGTVTGAPSNNNNNVTNTEDTSTKLEDGTTNKNTNGNEVAGATKSVGFKNEYSTHDLTFSKTVDGNQGSKDKYFEFTVTIDNLTEGTILDVDLTNADSAEIKANPNTATTVITADYTNPAKLVATEQEGSVYKVTDSTNGTKKIEVTYYLQHNQSIKIMGIPDGASYTITDGYEDYTASVDVKASIGEGENTKLLDNINGETGNDVIAGNKNGKVFEIKDSAIKADAQADFKNTRTGTIPTGIILSVAPTVIIGLVLIGGIVFLIIRNKKRKLEE